MWYRQYRDTSCTRSTCGTGSTEIQSPNLGHQLCCGGVAYGPLHNGAGTPDRATLIGPVLFEPHEDHNINEAGCDSSTRQR